MVFFLKGFRYLDYLKLTGSANRLLYFLTCSPLKQYINAGNFLKIFWDPICYQLYSNESVRNYSFSYNIDRKWRLPKLSSFYKVSTANKSHEPSDRTLAAQLQNLYLDLARQLWAPPAWLSPITVLPLSCSHWISPACSSSSWAVSSHLLATREGSVTVSGQS